MYSKNKKDTKKIIEGLTKNFEDSIQHAFNHFFELEGSKLDRWHDEKWIILSVHHSAECLLRMWLIEIDPLSPIINNQNGEFNFPHFDKVCKFILEYKGIGELTTAERKLILLIKRLNDTRNKIMHRIPSEKFNESVVSFAAMVIIGIYRVLQKRKGKSFYKIFDEYSDNYELITNAIHSTKLDEYSSLIMALLNEEYPDQCFLECPYCNTQAIINTTCQACFQDIIFKSCDFCGEEYYILADTQLTDFYETKCPCCNHKRL